MVLRYWKPLGKSQTKYDFWSGEDKLEIKARIGRSSAFPNRAGLPDELSATLGDLPGPPTPTFP